MHARKVTFVWESDQEGELQRDGCTSMRIGIRQSGGRSRRSGDGVDRGNRDTRPIHQRFQPLWVMLAVNFRLLASTIMFAVRRGTTRPFLGVRIAKYRMISTVVTT